jgi:hypothetical protein
MIDWSMLSPTFLIAVIEWAVAVVTVYAAGRDHLTTGIQGERKTTKRIPSHLSLPPIRWLAAE